MDQEAAFFKVLSEPIRLRLMILLAIEGRTCVCHLAEALDEPEYKVSRHLGIIRSAGLVQTERQGTWIFYDLTELTGVLQRCLLGCFETCFADHPYARIDLERLRKSTCRPQAQ
jgi:ArsR family transcriptional regulator, arsenate/arsenite/antimonite-responsive transcriptional repressor